MKQTQKTRLKRRIHAYRNFGDNWVYILESDFKGVFSPMILKKGFETSSDGFAKDLDNTINSCSEEECQELNSRLDCYQIDKKF